MTFALLKANSARPQEAKQCRVAGLASNIKERVKTRTGALSFAVGCYKGVSCFLDK